MQLMPRKSSIIAAKKATQAHVEIAAVIAIP